MPGNIDTNPSQGATRLFTLLSCSLISSFVIFGVSAPSTLQHYGAKCVNAVVHHRPLERPLLFGPVSA